MCKIIILYAWYLKKLLMHMHYVCGYRHMFFSERLYTFVHLYETVLGLYISERDFYCIRWNIFYTSYWLQNGHCGPVFYCVAYKCIWLSYKCIYIKVHLMQLMQLCRHSQAPRSSLGLIINTIIPLSLPLLLSLPCTLLHFFPWSEFRSATALTHTHDETEWDTIWLRLTHTLGIEVFLRAHVHTVGLPLMTMYARTHIIVGICPPFSSPPPTLYKSQ